MFCRATLGIHGKPLDLICRENGKEEQEIPTGKGFSGKKRVGYMRKRNGVAKSVGIFCEFASPTANFCLFK